MPNLPPKDSTSSKHLKKCCCAPCANLEATEIRLEQLKAAVVASEAEALQIRHAVNNIHDSLAQLPREIVALIFEAIYDDEEADLTDPPFKLGAVCRLWREIAWSTPKIWSRIHFTLDPVHEAENCVELLEQYVGRSGDHLLSVHLEWRHADSYKIERETFEPIVRVLKSSISRWCTLHLELPIVAYYLLGKDFPPASCSTLRHLTLLPVDKDGRFVHTLPIPGWTNITGNLKTFTLLNDDDSLQYLDLDNIRVDTSNLTQLHGSASCRGWLHFLQTSPHLTSATIDLLRDFARYHYPAYNHCSHTSLTSLFVTSPSPVDISEFLSRTTCSNLETLSIGDFTSPSATPSLNSMLNFLSGSSQLLCSLELFGVIWSSAELQQCLECLPRLEELSLYRLRDPSVYQIMEVVFGGSPSSLNADTSRQRLKELRLPRLETFALSTTVCSQTNTWKFLHILQTYVDHRQTMPEVIIDDVVSSLRLIDLKLEIRAASLGKAFPYMEKEHLQIIDRLRSSHDILIDIISWDGDDNDLVDKSIEYWERLEGKNI